VKAYPMNFVFIVSSTHLDCPKLIIGPVGEPVRKLEADVLECRSYRGSLHTIKGRSPNSVYFVKPAPESPQDFILDDNMRSDVTLAIAFADGA